MQSADNDQALNAEAHSARTSRIPSRLSTATRRMAIAMAVLLCVELLLRFTVGLGRPLLFLPDPAFGSMPAPNQDLHRFFSHIVINEFGMRSGHVPVAKSALERRILFVGDSVTFGTTYVDQKAIFTELIGEYYGHSSSPPTMVMNASSPGWAPSNELGFIRSKGIFAADLVVFVVNTKDLIQPFAPFTMSPMTPTRNPASAIGEALGRYIIPRIFGSSHSVDPGSGPSGDPQVEAETVKILDVLSAAEGLAHRNGAQFMIIYSPMIDDDIRSYSERWDKGVRMLMAWSLKEKVSIVDMRKEFSRYPESQIYFDGMHLRPFGHQIVSDEFLKTNR
jgi:hypothetical protein